MDVFPEDMILEPGELGAVSRGVMRAEDAERLNWYLRAILTANVYDVAVQSPLDAAPKMAEKYGVKIHLKREDLQPVFSFKLRGAYAKIAGLPDDVAQRGVIAASAGNHAQGVALAASRRAIPAHIVMPITTPQIKVDAVRELGARVTLHGDAYDDAFARAMAPLVAATKEEWDWTFLTGPHGDGSGAETRGRAWWKLPPGVRTFEAGRIEVDTH